MVTRAAPTPLDRVPVDCQIRGLGVIPVGVVFINGDIWLTDKTNGACIIRRCFGNNVVWLGISSHVYIIFVLWIG